MSLPHIPAIRRGKAYQSLETTSIGSVRSDTSVAEVSQVNAGLIRRDLRKIGQSHEALRSLTCERLVEICADAGDRFLNGDLPLGDDGPAQSPEDYVEALSATSGLPKALVRNNMRKVHQVLINMGTILHGLTRGLDLSAIDRGTGEQAGVPVSYYPDTQSLGVVLPSNSPGVNSLWIPAVPLKIPVVLKPGREEPWTPLRIIQALIAAGCPAEAFCFYPTDHEGSGAVMDGAGKALIFGGEQTVAQHANNPDVSVHGPGWSKVLLGEDQVDRWADHLDLMADSIVANGGRSCINASSVVVPRHGEAVAEALGERLAAITPRPHDDEEAVLSGFANPTMADAMDQQVDYGLKTAGATDVTARHRGNTPRRTELEGCTYLLPTVVHCESFDHPLANREFLFPYASVVEVPQEEMLDRIGPSLVVSAVTEDSGFTDALLRSPLIQRLNLGPMPTTQVSWEQPHEGNLFEFLYRRRAIQFASAAVPA